MSDVILMDIDIPEAGVKKAIANISQLTKEIEALKLKNKELDKTDTKFIKNAADVKALTQEVKVNERVVVANTKAQMANEGSVEQLRAQLSGVTVEWSKLSKEERENTDTGKALKKSKSELTAQLKQVEEATGDNRRSVGNYSLGMKDALGSTGALGKGTNALFSTFKANPLILLVTLFAGLIQKVAATQGAMDALDKIVQPVNLVFQKLIGIVQDLVGDMLPKLAKAIANPGQAIKDLGELILNNIINRFKAVGQIVKNIVQGDWAALGDSVLQLGTGVEGLSKKLGGTIEQLKIAAEEGKKLAALNIDIAEAQNALEISESKLNRTIEEQKAALSDLSKTSAQRQSAAIKATNAINELEKKKLEIIDLQIQKKAIEIKQNDTDRVAQGEYNKLLAEREDALRASATRQKEVTSQLNSVNKQAADSVKRILAEEVKFKTEAEKEKTRAEKEAAAERVEIARLEMQEKVNNAKLVASEELNAIKQLYVDGIFSRQQYDTYLYELQLKALETEKVLLEAAGQATIDIDTKILDFKIASIGKEVEITSLAETSKTDLVGKGAAAAGDILGKQSIAFKALSSAEAAINTYTAATAALKIPVFGPLQAALIVIQGLAQVAKINATPLPKFATGIIGVDGPGTGTSDSITANISKNESVMTSKVTDAFGPQLAQMEIAVGNKPRLGRSGRNFAKGVIGMDSNAARISGNVAMSESNSLIRNLQNAQITVSVVEIQDRIKDVDTAKSFAQVVE